MKYLLNGSPNGNPAWINDGNTTVSTPLPECCRDHNKTQFWFGYLTVIKCPKCNKEFCPKAQNCQEECNEII